MRKIILVVILLSTISQLWSQKKVQFFLSPSFTIGANRSPASVEFSQYTGWVTDRKSFNVFEDGKNFVPYQIGGKLDVGFSIQQRFLVFTGLAYTVRKEANYFRCDLCDLILPDKPSRVRVEFWEISLGVKFLVLKEAKFNPFLGSTLFYTIGKQTFSGGLFRRDAAFQSLGYRFSTGVSIELSQTFSIHLSAQIQNNFHPDTSYPIYRFQEMGLEMGLVKIFGRP